MWTLIILAVLIVGLVIGSPLLITIAAVMASIGVLLFWLAP
jgi:hypothetical protein